MSHEDEIERLWSELLTEVSTDEPDDLEVVKIFGDLAQKVLDDLENDDFEINPVQWYKLMKIIEALTAYADEHGGKVLPVNLVPKLRVGGVTAELPLIYFAGGEIFEVAKKLCDLSAISIDAKLNGVVVVSMNVPDVFRHKANT